MSYWGVQSEVYIKMRSIGMIKARKRTLIRKKYILMKLKIMKKEK
jgi:hypothetical protein